MPHVSQNLLSMMEVVTGTQHSPYCGFLTISIQWEGLMLHPVIEYALLRDIPSHEENGDEVFSK